MATVDSIVDSDAGDAIGDPALLAVRPAAAGDATVAPTGDGGADGTVATTVAPTVDVSAERIPTYKVLIGIDEGML